MILPATLPFDILVPCHMDTEEQIQELGIKLSKLRILTVHLLGAVHFSQAAFGYPWNLYKINQYSLHAVTRIEVLSKRRTSTSHHGLSPLQWSVPLSKGFIPIGGTKRS